MKTHLIKTSLLSAALVVGITGCATNPMAGNSNTAKENRHTTIVQTAKGAGVGCLAGAASGLFAGGLNLSNMVKRCAIGGAVGGIAGGVLAYQHELKAAKDLAAQANNTPGVRAQVITDTVAVDNPKGDKEETERFKSLPMEFDNDLVRAHNPGIADTLRKVAGMSDASRVPVTITVEGPEQDRRWMTATLRGYLKPNTTAMLNDACNAHTGLVLTPVPDVGAAQ